MIKFERTEVFGFEHAIRGMRNPKNSWDKSDSVFPYTCDEITEDCNEECPLHRDRGVHDDKCDFMGGTLAFIGPNDHKLMMNLRNAGTDHRKYLRMIVVYVDILAPLYWWKEFDTYKLGTVANSCSTMHKIHAKKFTLDDFSAEHLYSDELDFFKELISHLNGARELYLESKKKEDWWQMIQLLPSSYNQKRTVMLNYEVLANIYKSRKNHKLDEWAETKLVGDCPANMYPNKFTIGFCDWIKTLPYSELITGEEKNGYFEHDTGPDKVGKQVATPDPSTESEKVDGISNASLTLDDGANPSIKLDGVVEASITLDDSINAVRDALKGPKFATREALDENGNTCRGRDKSVADVLFDTVYGLNLSWFKGDEDFPDHCKKAMGKLNEGFKDKNNGK